ncbi:hypothetical protein [Novosphingobium sp. ST904]|jgi:hypothetical protein|uniref:hypothetical protein n=1 Tax=Novosphingobium sp. ST904 TaxID=1684385 RepID=UPI0006C8751C|nr:hypothetical protein [Novosphingobium sp. ST904]KPH66799.1 hypothetical protein ADT71_04395 [Novosphingobium sp. ST904]TCM28394.1 hypothetical protein EDF59_12923 [Novosphingobium sp. ST904]
MTANLPAGFETLEPFAANWAGRTAADRAAVRGAYPPGERAAFHAACAPLIEAGLSQLDAKPLRDLNEEERRLLDLILTYAHVSLAIDVQASDEDRHRPLREAMRVTRAPADF